MTEKTIRTRLYLVPFALVATGAMTIALPGCRKGEPVSESSAPSAPSYMEDASFRKALADSRKGRTALEAKRAELVGEMEKLVEAKIAAMPGAGEAELKAALEKDPAWVDLEKRVSDLTAVIGERRREAQGLVREKLVPKKEKVSK